MIFTPRLSPRAAWVIASLTDMPVHKAFSFGAVAMLSPNPNTLRGITPPLRFLAWDSAIIGQDKDWLAHCQDNVTEWDIGSWCQRSNFPVGQNYKVSMSVHCNKSITSPDMTINVARTIQLQTTNRQVKSISVSHIHQYNTLLCSHVVDRTGRIVNDLGRSDIVREFSLWGESS